MADIEESLRQMLNKIAVEHKYENHEIIIKPLSSGGANYSSILFTATIKEANKEDLHLFAKVAMLGEKLRSEAFDDVFKIERFAYTELAKIYSALEEEHEVPEEHRLHFAKYYGFDHSSFQEKLILENLLPQGYVPFDRFQSIDWEYASTAVSDMAKMHALSFAFSKYRPAEFEKVCATVLKMEIPAGLMDGMMQNSVDTAVQNVKSEYKEPLEKFLENHKKDPFLKFNSPVRKPIIIHGDFRGSNLLHRVKEDGKLEIKILDLQTLQPGSPACDLIYFIFTGSDEEFRAKYYEKLIDHYYTELSASMKRLHLDPEEVFSREDFEYELKEKLPVGLAMVVFVLPLVTVLTEDAPAVDKSLDLTTLSVDKPSDLFVERINGIVNDYVKLGILKV